LPAKYQILLFFLTDIAQSPNNAHKCQLEAVFNSLDDIFVDPFRIRAKRYIELLGFT
jgi:hypothetical protein